MKKNSLCFIAQHTNLSPKPASHWLEYLKTGLNFEDVFILFEAPHASDATDRMRSMRAIRSVETPDFTLKVISDQNILYTEDTVYWPQCLPHLLAARRWFKSLQLLCWYNNQFSQMATLDQILAEERVDNMQ